MGDAAMWTSTRKRQLTKQELATLKRIHDQTVERDTQRERSRARLKAIVQEAQPNEPTIYAGLYSDSTKWTKEETLALALKPLAPLGPADISGQYHLRSIKHPFPIPGSQVIREKERMTTALAKKLSIGINIASASEPSLHSTSHCSAKSDHQDCLHTLESGKLHFTAQSMLDILQEQQRLLQKQNVERLHRLASVEGTTNDLATFWRLLAAGRTRETVLMLTEHVFLDINVAVVQNTTDGTITLNPTKSHSLALTPLMAAARLLNVDVVGALLDRGADPNVPNGNGDTPLHYVWRDVPPNKPRNISIKWTLRAQKAVAILDNLLGHGALANTTNSFAETPLHYCAKLGIQAAVMKLLHKGADPRMPDRTGHTALDYAKLHGNMDILSVMANFHSIETEKQRCDDIQRAKDIPHHPGQTSLPWSTPPDRMLQQLKLASHRAAYLKGHCVTKDGTVVLAPNDDVIPPSAAMHNSRR
ncbi:hypothetical protein H310_04529 [Aphanomyces invadans]|uniref:Uncharacterized protein n=1 Tax=Aphanomyces invadans TaxID=157072 RepID=A0A024UEV8_9STRA|nr:hypothetical protein H310_04529 [Aphanomyces invadans]ETW04183.1 hypothetical protein H310_04529 [Aphanomyces invadans]|eukprot:XP_008867139.1 hypothetical protein H310_04529 [Aphanomyces invadans]